MDVTQQHARDMASYLGRLHRRGVFWFKELPSTLNARWQVLKSRRKAVDFVSP